MVFDDEKFVTVEAFNSTVAGLMGLINQLQIQIEATMGCLVSSGAVSRIQIQNGIDRGGTNEGYEKVQEAISSLRGENKSEHETPTPQKPN